MGDQGEKRQGGGRINGYVRGETGEKNIEVKRKMRSGNRGGDEKLKGRQKLQGRPSEGQKVIPSKATAGKK